MEEEVAVSLLISRPAGGWSSLPPAGTGGGFPQS